MSLNLPLLRLLRHPIWLIWIRPPHRNLASHGPRLGHRPIHARGVGPNPLKHLHLIKFAAGVGLLERLQARRLHVLALVEGLLDALAAGAAARRARPVRLQPLLAPLLLQVVFVLFLLLVGPELLLLFLLRLVFLVLRLGTRVLAFGVGHAGGRRVGGPNVRVGGYGGGIYGVSGEEQLYALQRTFQRV